MTLSTQFFNISEDGDSTTSLDNLFHPQSENMVWGFHILMEIHVFQFVPIASCCVCEHHRLLTISR